MNRDEIIEAIERLSYVQGFYERLLQELIYLKEYNLEAYDARMEELEEREFTDVVDMVMYFEE